MKYLVRKLLTTTLVYTIVVYLFYLISKLFEIESSMFLGFTIGCIAAIVSIWAETYTVFFNSKYKTVFGKYLLLKAILFEVLWDKHRSISRAFNLLHSKKHYLRIKKFYNIDNNVEETVAYVIPEFKDKRLWSLNNKENIKLLRAVIKQYRKDLNWFQRTFF